MRKDYYYIDESSNQCELSTAVLENQAKIEAHLEKHAQKYKYDPLTGEKIKIKGKKRTVVDDQIVESDQDFLILIEPFDDLDIEVIAEPDEEIED